VVEERADLLWTCEFIFSKRLLVVAECGIGIL